MTSIRQPFFNLCAFYVHIVLITNLNTLNDTTARNVTTVLRFPVVGTRCIDLCAHLEVLWFLFCSDTKNNWATILCYNYSRWRHKRFLNGRFEKYFSAKNDFFSDGFCYKHLVKSFTQLLKSRFQTALFSILLEKKIINSKRRYNSLSKMSWGEMLFKFSQIFPPKNLKYAYANWPFLLVRFVFPFQTTWCSHGKFPFVFSQVMRTFARA